MQAAVSRGNQMHAQDLWDTRTPFRRRLPRDEARFTCVHVGNREGDVVRWQRAARECPKRHPFSLHSCRGSYTILLYLILTLPTVVLGTLTTGHGLSAKTKLL